MNNAKKFKEMADSIVVRNHLFTMLNTGRIPKEMKNEALKFLDYVDQEILNTSLSMVPEGVETIQQSTRRDFVNARERQQNDRTKTSAQAAMVSKSEMSAGVVKRVG